ncbi:RidA family protein [Sphingosinithalassobacter tenebrarum]|uniref:RidA family protein n=2 Tax=Stakelama tenebrarum TaxID=2711215 RepID=A0A6G6YAZ4_9SPHN|nr:RidA family protein [Sphingosinithalassobacter tenebrarum]
MRKRVFSGSPFETPFAYCRAVRTGDTITVAGTAPIEDDGSNTPGDAGVQADRCFAIILRAVEQLGGLGEDIVRTRMYITDPADAELVGAAHGRWMTVAQPAATMVVVSALIDPDWKVEIEADAVVGSRG